MESRRVVDGGNSRYRNACSCWADLIRYPLPLIISKILFFSTSMSGVGWNKFQSIFFIEKGLSTAEIGMLKAFGLALKILGEPFWCIIADVTDDKTVFVFSMVMNILTMEMFRQWTPLTFSYICMVKILRTSTAPGTTLMTTASFKLIEGSGEGYGKQRLFGSLAWGFGAFFVGYLIDTLGIDSIFYVNYFFFFVSLSLVLLYLPASARHGLFRRTESEDKQSDTEVDVSVDGKNRQILRILPENDDDILLRSRGGVEHLEDQQDGSIEPLLLSQTNPTSTAREFSSSKSLLHQFRSFVVKYRSFFKSQSIRIFCINIFIYGCVMVVPDTFFFINLEKQYGASRTFNGLCTLVSTLACLPIFWFSENLIRNYGHHKLISLSQLLCVIRLVLYTVVYPDLPHVYIYIVCIQLIHGFNFALFWAASVDAIFKLAPKDLCNSCMATLNMIYFTLAGIVGNSVAGYIYEDKGPVVLYYLAAFLLSINILFILNFREEIEEELKTV